MQDFNARDLFAGLALVGLIAKNGYALATPSQAYVIAEQMLIEKEKRDGGESEA